MDNPYDEANVRTHDFRCIAKLERAKNPEHFTLTLDVLDGPETFADFDPAEKVNPDGECTLTTAIATVANRMIQAALEIEAGRWIEDHDEVFIVRGTTGQGLGIQTWSVKAFISEDRAAALCNQLNYWCETYGLAPNGYRAATFIDPEGLLVKHPYDPNFRVDQGTEYELVRMPLDMFPCG